MAVDALRGSRRHEFDDTADDRDQLAATRLQAMARPELSRVYLSLPVNGRTLYPDATVHSGGALSAQLTERGDQGAEGSESKADCFTRESVRR